jgi:hypothetical protein
MWTTDENGVQQPVPGRIYCTTPGCAQGEGVIDADGNPVDV